MVVRREKGFSAPAKGFGKWIGVYLLAPLLAVGFGYFTGSLIEQQKFQLEREKFLLEQKLRVWAACAKHFSDYITNWDRLRKIATSEKQVASLSPDERTRKNRYVNDRDAARVALQAALWEASLIYGEPARKPIETYFEFDREQAAKRLEELPSVSQWEHHRDEILNALRGEVLPRR